MLNQRYLLALPFSRQLCTHLSYSWRIYQSYTENNGMSISYLCQLNKLCWAGEGY
uniref:Uncharacterized protein n=1 Tax=Anguilla anguilla TaxID=7936 RepID=A0A0E9XDP2_ANGAN